MAAKKGFDSGAHAFSIQAVPKHMDKYEVEDAARTLEKHQEIRANKKLHRAAISHLKRKHKLIARATKG